METFFSGQDLLFTLLMKVGVAASLAALLVRWEVFRKVLFTEVRDSDLKLKLLLFLTPALALGVILRLLGYPYRFADLMLEGSFLLGLLGGRVVGPARRRPGEPAGISAPRMACTVDGRVCRLGGRVDPSGGSEQGGHLGFRAVHISQRSPFALAIFATQGRPVGHASARGLPGA